VHRDGVEAMAMQRPVLFARGYVQTVSEWGARPNNKQAVSRGSLTPQRAASSWCPIITGQQFGLYSMLLLLK
jgi:hypothetical protein